MEHLVNVHPPTTWKPRCAEVGEPCIKEVRSGRGGRSVDRRNAPGAAITFAKAVIR